MIVFDVYVWAFGLYGLLGFFVGVLSEKQLKKQKEE